MQKALLAIAALSLAACGPAPAVLDEGPMAHDIEPGTEAIATPVPPCDGKPAFDAPNGTAKVALPKDGPVLSINVPSNEQWADVMPNSAFPYASTVDGFFFGMPRWTDSANLGTTCDMNRDFALYLAPARAAADIEKDFEARYDDPTVERLTVAGLPAVLLADVDGVCPAPKLEISGPGRNVVIETSCTAIAALGREELLEQLKGVADTIRFE